MGREGVVSLTDSAHTIRLIRSTVWASPYLSLESSHQNPKTGWQFCFAFIPPHYFFPFTSSQNLRGSTLQFCSHLPLLFGYAVLSSTSSLTSLSHKAFSHFWLPVLDLSLIHSLVMNAALSPVSVLCERISIAVTKSSASTPTHSQKPVYIHPTSKSNTSTYECVHTQTLTETNAGLCSASSASCSTLYFWIYKERWTVQLWDITKCNKTRRMQLDK